MPALTRTRTSLCELVRGDRGPSARAYGVCLTAPFWPQIVPYNKRVIHCRTGGLTMHTIILAIVIALAGLVMIASGALQLSMLEAAEGEMLQMSDYLSEIGTLASGLGMLGLAEVLRLLLRITAYGHRTDKLSEIIAVGPCYSFARRLLSQRGRRTMMKRTLAACSRQRRSPPPRSRRRRMHPPSWPERGGGWHGGWRAADEGQELRQGS